MELIVELESIDRKIKAAEKDLTALVLERGSTLLELTGMVRPAQPDCWLTWATSTASSTGIGSPPGTAPRRWTRPR